MKNALLLCLGIATLACGEPADEPEPPCVPPADLSLDSSFGGRWLGGDFRNPRNVGDGQSVTLDRAVSMRRFAFKFAGPFLGGPGTISQSVALTLQLRDATGAVLAVAQASTPLFENQYWVYWDLAYQLKAGTTYVFTVYSPTGLSDGLSSGIVTTNGDTYPGGSAYSAELLDPAESMEPWSVWFARDDDHAWKIDDGSCP